MDRATTLPISQKRRPRKNFVAAVWVNLPLLKNFAFTFVVLGFLEHFEAYSYSKQDSSL